MDLLPIFKTLFAPAWKIYEQISTPKDDIPTLVQEPNGIDTGTPKWAREYSDALRQHIRAEGNFFLKCTGGQCRYAELFPTQDIFTRISPAMFSVGDSVTVTFDLDRYDKHVLLDKKPLLLKIRGITGKGRKVTLKYKCEGYGVKPVF